MDFREGRPRDTSLVLAAGERRGGKTFDLLLCSIALLIDIPTIDDSSSVGWVVSASYQERDEIDKTIREYIPPSWYSHRQAPEHRYTFANGASLKNVSADHADTLKRGRVDVILYNEAQKMPVSALSAGIYGTVDKGGLALLAANPPRNSRGEWLYALKEQIDEGKLSSARYFGFRSKDNANIDQDARGRVGEILRAIDPKAASADDEGLWIPIGDRAYDRFDKVKNLGPVPELADVTGETLHKITARQYLTVAGVDFQGTPHHAGVMVRAFNNPAGAGPIYWVVDEQITEGVEEEFLADIDAKGLYDPSNLLWIGDASGQWQDGKHTAGRGRMSFDIFRKFRWHIKPPVLKKSDKGEFSKNPDIYDRLNLVNKLLSERRLVIDPARCPVLAESIKDCPFKSINGKRRPYGRHSHITDALGYVLFWLEPKPQAPRVAPLRSSIFTSMPVRHGPRML